MAPILPTHNREKTGKHRHTPKRLPRLSFIPNRVRNELIAMLAEFGGTFMFLFFAFVGTQVANAAAAVQNAGTTQANHSLSQAPNTSSLLFISLAFGFSLAVNVWAFFRISGGLFNPVVSTRIPSLRSHSPVSCKADDCLVGDIGSLPYRCGQACASGPVLHRPDTCWYCGCSGCIRHTSWTS